MTLVNHEPVIKSFGNGFQITFPNKYTLIAKNGLGANCTQTLKLDDAAEMLMASRFGANSGPDIECEVYAPSKQNISNKFGNLGFVGPIQLVNLLYVISSLK